MNKVYNIRKSLLISYLIVGLINFILITIFSYTIYANRKNVVFNRAMDHMESTQALSQRELISSFDKRKLLAKLSSNDFTAVLKIDLQDKALSAILSQEGQSFRLLYGEFDFDPAELFALETEQFSETNNHHYALKVIHQGKTYVWIYNSAIFEELTAINGLGRTGEIYLVGSDHKLKSSSRHVTGWQSVSVRNSSIENAFRGLTGVGKVQDYRNVNVISAYGPFNYDNLQYALLAEIDTQEITEQLYDILEDLLLICGALIFINFVFSIFFTRSMGNKIKELQNQIFNLNRLKEKQTNEVAIQLIKVQEEEREKLSFTLHDSVGQYLTVLRWGLSNMKQKAPEYKEQLENLLKTCDDIIHEIRSISNDLMPTLIKDFGCCHAINDYFEKQKQIVPLKMHFEYDPNLLHFKLRKEFEVNLYRMIQEFFNNTLKHSKASEIEANIKIKNDKLELFYKDNGIGMDPKRPLPTSLSYRARLFGGDMVRLNNEKGLALKVIFSTKEICYENN